MGLFNYLFYIVLFVGLFLPSNNSFFIPVGGALISISTIAFISLPLINIFCVSKNRIGFGERKQKRKIYLFLAIIVFTEVVIKNLLFGQGVSDAFKAIRIGIPLFSSLILLAQGLRANIEIVWKVLLLAICSSVFLSLLSLIVPLPIYFNLEEGVNVLESSAGRLPNSNASFGIIGLYLLFENKDKWYNKGNLVKWASILSIIALILTFNRTYLALLILEAAILIYRNLKVREILRALFFVSIFLGIGLFAYQTSDIVQRQFDKRVLSIIIEENTLIESTIEGNRDVIYEGMTKRIEEGYWIIGMPINIPVFSFPPRFGKEGRDLMVTDTSFMNILLRYGIIPLILWCSILIQVFWRKSDALVRYSFLIYVLASLNTDSLMRQNSIFFITVILFITVYSHAKKNRIHNKDRHQYRWPRFERTTDLTK